MNLSEKNLFIQQNSPDGGFLQSPEWAKFQESTGKNTYNISLDNFWTNIIKHELPVVGKYFYVPRGPIMARNIEHGTWNKNLNELVELAKKNNAGWIRIEPANDEILESIKNNISHKIAKAPHDMQPREIFIIDIEKPEEQLLAEMKAKTRYNIRLAEKKEVRIKKQEVSGEYINEFVRLTQVMAKRQGIATHPASYYRKMLEIIPGDILKLYIAEYKNKIIAANLVVFYGKTCTYLHGASDDSFRNVMAPYLLQWQQIKDAKAQGCTRYDFGGVKINSQTGKSWAGVTKFKTGFSPSTKPTEFPGSYDIVISPVRYWMYRAMQKMKSLI